MKLKNSQSNFIKYCDLVSIFSAEYEGTDYINKGSTTDQRRINDVSLAPPLATLAAPDDSLLELAPPPLRNERQSQTNRDR